MTRQILGENAKAEIRESIGRCRNSKEIAAMVRYWADHFNVGKDRIYAVTKDLRTKRKTRADKGKRLVDLQTNEDVRLVVGQILEYGGLTSADAIVNARNRGKNIPIEFTTLNRYMREAGLTRKTRRTANTPHRRFEAAAPGEMFQFDISGVKERWFDHQTRRIISVSSLEVSKNHENEKANRTRVWRFALVDDYSRRCFVRYVGVAKPNSSHVVDFLLQAYAEMGVPIRLYTDNDKIIKFGRNARTTQILNKVLIDQGGYENVFHIPGNARATGKVERLHQTVEQCEKFIGQYLKERGNLSLEELNDKFAAGVMSKINNAVHSETAQTPMQRWESQFSVIRRLDYESLRSAFMADEFIVKLRGDLTFRLKGQSHQLPGSDMYPFANWIGQKLRIVFPDDQQFFTVIGLDGNEYDVVKEASAPDAAGEFKSTRQMDSERLRKEVRAIAKEDAKRIRAASSPPVLGGVADASADGVVPIRFFDDVAAEAEATNVAQFPKPETTIDPVRVDVAAPGRVAQDLYTGRLIHFWEAVPQYEAEFASKAECKSFMDSIFESRDETCFLAQSEIEKAIESRKLQFAEPVRHLKAV